MIYQLGTAIEFIHDRGVAHLDIKLQNLLLDELCNLKMGDFGSVLIVGHTRGGADEKRGTIGYMAPEVAGMKEGEVYDAYAADIFSLGVGIHIMLTGRFPFKNSHKMLLSTNSSDGVGGECNSEKHTDFGASLPALGSPEIKDLISNYLIGEDPADRAPIKDVLEHPWFSNIDDLNKSDIFDFISEKLTQL